MSKCPHGVLEREHSACFDGRCPICLSAEIAALKAQVAVAERALSFYCDASHYLIELDGGKNASAALATLRSKS